MNNGLYGFPLHGDRAQWQWQHGRSTFGGNGAFNIRSFTPAVGSQTEWWMPVAIYTGGTAATQAPTVNTQRLIPYYLDRDTYITKLGYEVTTVGASANVGNVAVYTSQYGNNYPGQLLCQTGDIDNVGSTGVKSAPVNTLLRGQRWYWFGYQNGAGTSATIRAVPTGGCWPIGMAAAFGSGIRCYMNFAPAAYGPWQQVFPPGAGFTTNVAAPLIGFAVYG